MCSASRNFTSKSPSEGVHVQMACDQNTVKLATMAGTVYFSQLKGEPEIYWSRDIISFGRSSAAFISKSVIIYSCVYVCVCRCVYVCVHDCNSCYCYSTATSNAVISSIQIM